MVIQPPWPEVQLKRILTYLDKRVELADMEEYITITIKRRHGGLEARERLWGHQIKTKKQFQLVPGAFILSRVQCWHQPYALVPDDVPPNMIASSNYDQFAISPEVDRRFFLWLSRSPTFTETVRSSASGVVIEKMVFNRDVWLEKSIPLPPLSEQRRIVARIEELAAKIEEARGLRREAVEEAEVLLANSLSHVFDYQHPDSLPNGWEWKPLDDLLLNKKEGMVTGPFGTLLQKSDVQSDGIPILGIANVQANHFVAGFSDHVSPWKADTLSSYRLDQEDIVIARSGTVGRSCVIPTGIDPAPIMSTNLMRLRLDTKIFLPRLLCSLFNGSRLVERHKDLECRGSTRSFFTQKILTKLQIPVPPLSKQHHILSYLEDLQAKVNKLKRLQTETAEELDALLPSVLDKAFRGEL